MARQKGRTETSAERGLGLRNTTFRSGHLGRVPRQEVVHRLLWGQLGNRRQHAERIGRQENDVLGVVTPARDDGVRDVVQGIRSPSVLGDRRVVEIDLRGPFVQNHVFQDGPEHLCRAVDLRLAFEGKLDRFRVTSALEVEHAPTAPPVLVVSDEPSFRIGRQRGLSRTGEAKKERRVPVRPNIGRAVHR